MEKNMLFRHIPRSRWRLKPSIPDAEGNDFRDEGGDIVSDNVEEAKKIMESKGYNADNMLTIEYKYNNLATHKAVAESMQNSLKQI